MSATLRLRVVPNAKRNEIAGLHGDAIKVKVRAPAMEGRATEALLEFLAERLALPRPAVQLLAGEKSRDKVMALTDLDPEEARRRLLGTESRGVER